MPDPIDQYLDELLAHAKLARAADRRRVRAELRDHLASIVQTAGSHDPAEVLLMLNREFGEPRRIGKAIGAATGNTRSFLKRRVRRIATTLAITLMLALSVRMVVAEAFHATSDSASPMIPPDSRLLVYKLASHFAPGDVVVFHPPGTKEAWLGVVKQIDVTSGSLVLHRSNRPEVTVAPQQVVGRVVANTR